MFVYCSYKLLLPCYYNSLLLQLQQQRHQAQILHLHQKHLYRQCELASFFILLLDLGWIHLKYVSDVVAGLQKLAHQPQTRPRLSMCLLLLSLSNFHSLFFFPMLLDFSIQGPIEFGGGVVHDKDA